MELNEFVGVGIYSCMRLGTSVWGRPGRREEERGRRGLPETKDPEPGTPANGWRHCEEHRRRRSDAAQSDGL